jgi:hypothetical protein
LSGVAETGETGEILRRALAYPYATPERSYLYGGGGATELPSQGPDLEGRAPLLSYGANSAPEALARKLAPLPAAEMPVLRAELEGFDVVYSAHVSPYGAVPATLKVSAGTRVPVFVLYPNPEQLALLTLKEPNYDLVTLEGLVCRLEGGKRVEALDAYTSLHGCLSLGGSEVALAAVRAAGRILPELDEPAVLEHVRSQLEPTMDLESFILTSIAHGGLNPLPPLEPL